MQLRRTDIQRELAARELSHFVAQAWPLVEPGAFVEGIHTRLICDALDRVARGEIRRLLINVPPRHGKSTDLRRSCSPAWRWATVTAGRGSCLPVTGTIWPTRRRAGCVGWS